MSETPLLDMLEEESVRFHGAMFERIKMEGLTTGSIVHYIMPGGKHRPAIIVNVHNQETGSVNLQVFLDNLNDNAGMDFNVSQHEAGLRWITSVLPDETGKQDDTWHWIERA